MFFLVLFVHWRKCSPQGLHVQCAGAQDLSWLPSITWK